MKTIDIPHKEICRMWEEKCKEFSDLQLKNIGLNKEIKNLNSIILKIRGLIN